MTRRKRGHKWEDQGRGQINDHEDLNLPIGTTHFIYQMYLLKLDIWEGYIVFILASYLVFNLTAGKMKDDDLVDTIL